MKSLFASNKKKFKLIAYASWGNYRDISEVVLEGTMQEIKNYATKNALIWESNENAPNGGIYVKSIDGYRSKTFDVIPIK
jgi:hypothetical protein